MRVIAGKYKGRLLDAMEGRQTRPTSDMIKESIYNLIGPYFEADTAVDLFSGSGSLGIEAVSRGVKEAYLIDSNPEAINIIEQNVASLDAGDECHVMNTTAQAALDYFSHQQIKINLLLLDPPYDMDIIEELLIEALEKEVLSPRALVVCESSKRIDFAEEIGSLQQIKNRTYGKTRICVYQNTEEIGE